MKACIVPAFAALAAVLVSAACDRSPTPTPAHSASATMAPHSPSAPPSAAPSATAPIDPIPPGSGDYSAVLALATKYKDGALSFAELQRDILARGLKVHPLGDGYLMTPVPQPPPGVKFDPRMMPKDWEGTWGEVAMAFWLGRLTRDEYDRLHAAAHPTCPR